MKILVIEDNPDISYLINYILEDEGHSVESFSDAQGLDNIAEMAPDVVLMDEILAGARGSELCKKLKADPATAHLKVILMSAVTHVAEIAAKCGADAYIEKPFDIDVLINEIKSFA